MSFVETYRELASEVPKGIEQKRAFLDFLNNAMPFDSPSGNLQVQVHDHRGLASRWRDWFDVRDNDWWVEHVNHRLIGIPELVVDVDPDSEETQEAFWDRCRKIANLFREQDEWHLMGMYATGSRGVHIHSLNPSLMRYHKCRVADMKRLVLTKLGADTQKGSTRCVIAIEGVPHWKTGHMKTEAIVGNRP